MPPTPGPWMLPGPFAGESANPGEPPMKNVAKTVRLPARLWERLEMHAEQDRRSVNSMLWVAVEEWAWARSRGVELRRDEDVPEGAAPRAAEGGERRKAPLDGWGEP